MYVGSLLSKPNCQNECRQSYFLLVKKTRIIGAKKFIKIVFFRSQSEQDQFFFLFCQNYFQTENQFFTTQDRYT